MSRNVLISFLGLSNYIPCYYTIEGNPASLTRYVQTALYEHISKKVGELEVVIFCTKEAEERNWLGDEYSKGLRKTFHDIAPEARVKRVIIPSQQDERGNWELFDLIMNEIQADDEIYFDVTHSFRTNPIVALIVLNYAQVVKGASIGGLMYGWFEKLGSASEISELNKEERRIPIVDFTIMANLLSWTKGVDQFIRTGNASVLTDLATTESKLFYSQQDQTNTRDFAKMKSLIEQLNRVSLHFETVRTKSLYNEINKWKEKTDEVKNTRTQHFRQLIPLMDTIEKKS